ncbi:MAG TPA: 1-deoxy-D-xylulose-5-phosphate reductoisomerase [Blastocatellia bacterium]|nr:1-deoxy-D-xylulose-5-phosphate reductoisomerase [Blastocatellia bacterium]
MGTNKKVAILGSTGSVGCNTLRVIESMPEEFKVTALAAGSSIQLLTKQILKFQPEIVSVATESAASELQKSLKTAGVSRLPEICTGTTGLVQVATHPGVHIVVSAIVGSLGFVPTYRALELGRRVALANKETLVMAGELMTRAAKQSGAEILPVDSEHNAIHQCLRGERRDEVKRIILTASGGPFRTLARDEFEKITVDAALKHPTWKMGQKITIDSATLMNKGLEVIEAGWLFGFRPDEVDVLIHPQSTVHSMVEMIDGSIIAQLGVTDMRHPIQYALTYPDRCVSPLPPLDLTQLRTLEFFEPDNERFPCLGLAYQAMQAGGMLPAVMSAANEVAVEAFIGGAISFTSVFSVISETMAAYENRPVTEIEEILSADQWSRNTARRQVGMRTCDAAISR